MKILKLDDMTSPNLNVLVYAPPGNGKTRLMGTMAKVCKPLILSAESGLLSLKKLSKELNYNFDYFPITNFGDLETAYKYLAFGNKEKFTGVGMDSITEIQKVCMDAILAAEGRDKAMIQDWGTLNQKMVSLIRAYRDLDMHFMGTCLSDRDKDEETGQIMTMPYVQGALQKTIDGYFDEVFYLHAKDIKQADNSVKTTRWLQTQGTNNIRAKDRSGVLNREEPADFKVIYDKIIGQTKKTEAPKVEEPPKAEVKQLKLEEKT
jgi:hypothetical protein